MVVRCFTSFALHKQKQKKGTTNTRDNNNKKQHRWYIEIAELNTAKWKATRAKCRFKVSPVSIDRPFLVSFWKNRQSHDARHEPGPRAETTVCGLRSTVSVFGLRSTVYGIRSTGYEYCLQSAVCRQLFIACCLRLLNCREERVETKRYTNCAVDADVAVCRLPKNGRHVCGTK